ncbi:MAG TPA: TetR/AcrR family transcriptional regulator [Acetobacteraceae bacterium]|nr:TetR/AcrR family transcriptional regulator [Acetobacteraceae bacterium]
MTFRGDRSERGYHHGNLREAMVQAALRLIREHGPSGFSFAEVARLVGVSGAAPYRHFRDRNALLAEVARQGFVQFASDLAAAWNNGRPNPVRALENCGRAYLAFARREPAAYAAMFEPGAPLDDNADLTAASDRAFAVLRGAAEAVIATLPDQRRPPILMVALHIWAFSHGIASLFIGGHGGARRKTPMAPEELLEAGLLIYLQSLGVVTT